MNQLPPIEEAVRRHGLRLTPQRQVILEILRSTRAHPDATWVFQQVRQRLPHVSLGTVYRNLATLAEKGLIQEIPLTDNATHWDGDTTPHAHILCQDCRRIADLPSFALPQAVQEQAQRASGFTLLGYRILFIGVCPSCAQRQQQTDVAEG